MLKQIQKTFFMAVAALMLFSCASSHTSESTGQYIDSTAITAKVKASLIDKLGTKAFSIKVKTYKDQVQLSGFVSETSTKAKAERIAATTGNVKRVINDIIVK